MKPAYTVIWNGSRAHAGGALLFGAEHVTTQDAPPVRPRRHGDISGTVRRLRNEPAFADWFTLAQVMAKTKFYADQVNSAVSNLQRTGEVERERKSVMRARATQRYRFVR